MLLGNLFFDQKQFISSEEKYHFQTIKSG